VSRSGEIAGRGPPLQALHGAAPPRHRKPEQPRNYDRPATTATARRRHRAHLTNKSADAQPLIESYLPGADLGTAAPASFRVTFSKHQESSARGTNTEQLI